MKNYKLLVFDWDGTLVDSAGLAIESIQKVAADFGDYVPPTATVRKHFGLSLDTLQQQLFPQIDYAAFSEAFHNYFTEEKLATYFFPKAIETLNYLKQQGFILAIATNKPRTKLETALDIANIKNLFAATRSPDDNAPKPNPEMLLSLLIDLKCNPYNTLMIGDTIFDMQFARNAKVDALAVCYGHNDQEQMATFNPVGFITDIKELKKFLKIPPKHNEENYEKIRL